MFLNSQQTCLNYIAVRFMSPFAICFLSSTLSLVILTGLAHCKANKGAEAVLLLCM